MNEIIKKKLKIKILLSIIIISIVVIIYFYNNNISFSDFNYFSFEFDINDILNRIYELKEYILFFIIIIPSCYFLRKSNSEWEKIQIEKFEKNEEIKKKEKEEKRQEEFENKMRGIHFKED